MKIVNTPQPIIKTIISSLEGENSLNPHLFETVLDEVVNKHSLTANFATGKGFIEIPAITKEALAELKRLNIHYEQIKVN